jgi:hypothetical protein
MKKIFIITVLFSSHLLLSQINLNSPWLKDLKINPDEKLNYNSIIMAGEKYWETHDKFSKEVVINLSKGGKHIGTIMLMNKDFYQVLMNYLKFGQKKVCKRGFLINH